MPRSRNRAVAAESASAAPSRRRGMIRSSSGLIFAILSILAAPSPGLAWQSGPEVQSQVAIRSTDPGAASGLPRAAEVDVSAARTQTEAQLKALDSAASSGSTATSPPGVSTRSGLSTAPSSAVPAVATVESAMDKQLREVFHVRLRWVDEYDKASKALKKAANPERSPEQQLADAEEQLGRFQATLTESVARPETLLPPPYRALPAGGSPRLSSEMKDALEAAIKELKEWNTRLESLRTEVVNWEGLQNTRRTERDKLFQRVTSLKARGPDRDAITASTTNRSRQLAQERQVNLEWQSRVEVLRLQAVEAELALEAKLTGVRELNLQVCHAQIQVLEKSLGLMQQRYRASAEQQESELKAKAALEENTARESEDVLERFRAHRLADLLELEAQVIKNEQAEVTSSPPTLDEESRRADHAEADFARIKALLDDGRVSRLDAIRLTNDFRRIGPERERLLHHEMAIVETRLQFYEDVLTDIEIELLQDSPHDRFEHDLLRERLPPSRWAESEALLKELEQKHRALLVRRRASLERLTDCTAQTLDQIARRLGILDEEYGFIRTHIFWVRDQEPIGLGTITQGARELDHLVKALARMVQEIVRPRHWGRASAEFVTAALGVLGLPFGLFRLRRFLRARIGRDLPPAQQAGPA
jgi:hypothetical protein